GQDPQRIAAEVRKTAYQRRAVQLLELVELGAVDQAGDDLAHVVGLAQVGRQQPVELRRVAVRLARGQRRARIGGGLEAHDDAPRDGERVGVVLGVVVADARL